MNRLSRERSPYLRHAAGQPVHWYPWCDEAFERARREGKPVFLSTGTVWCHWCHVMARESFEDAETAEILNAEYICIKLDRDERPDIDRRYQQSVAALGGGSGWPLSVFLTPDRQPFFGGTYFPPDDLQGRPAFRTVLRRVGEYYRADPERARDQAERIREALAPAPLVPDDLLPSLLADAERSMLALVDTQHGGFGHAPKFPMPGALEFLLCRSFTSQHAAEAAKRMLHAMADGGMHDHLGGGFHRYSVDEAWIVPHFEKMADDNAGLLRSYLDGYAVFGDERFRDVARGILSFSREVLSDPEGGFFASQDADVTPEDEGGYFTWTDAELRAVLDHEEYPLIALHLLHERGSMHHAPERNVLFPARPVAEIAERLGKDEQDVRRLIKRSRNKLLDARRQRQAPFIDRTLYTSLNGMMIGSFFHASSVLGDEEASSFAVRSLERIFRERLTNGALFHGDGIPAMLEDHVHLIDAVVFGHLATGDPRYRAIADELMRDCISRFYDEIEGGFHDTESDVLGARLKRIEDVPHPSANAVAIMNLLKLAALTGSDAYRQRAEQSLRAFARACREMSVHAGSYYCALDAWFRLITLTVEAPVDSELAREARKLAAIGPVVIRYGPDRGRVVPCRGTVCFEPVTDEKTLRTTVELLLRGESSGGD